MEIFKLIQKIFITGLLVSIITGCEEGKKMDIIYYGTSEFSEFIEKSEIKLDEAWDLQLKYYSDKSQEPIGSPLFFIINQQYLFSPYYNPKIPEVSIQGVAIDSITGKVEYINENIKLKPKSQFGWRKE